MGKIKVLAEDVARQIAAGEVVERPASVVKELLENSLDAGARSVTIRTRGAGVKLIEVHDDGCGMGSDDVALAAESFATSKIERSSDLFRVQSYGFRGEALASISSVSRFELLSSERRNGEGWSVRTEGKAVVDNKPAAHERGTTVSVRELFFNTPARKKFLKSGTTERRRILETVLSFALIDPALEIHYSEDSKPVVDLVPAGSWRERVASILGSATMKHMVELKSDGSGPYRIRGFASLPTHTRANRNQQYLFVNRRLVKERTMIRAIMEAYRGVIPPKRFPVVVLSLEAPYAEVDVNVHPTKLEVRLNNPRRVFDVIHRGLKTALSGRSESSIGVNYAGAARSPEIVPAPLPPGGLEPAPSAPPNVENADAGSYQTQIKDAYSSYMKGHTPPVELNPQLSLQIARDKEDAPDAPQEPSMQDGIQSDGGLFWQFNNSFIFIQVRGGIVVIDQHAAHERIIYDTSKSQI